MKRRNSPRAAQPIRVHFLDVGPEEYGDAVLCELKGTTVLIDGAHPGNKGPEQGHRSIPDQLRSLLGAGAADPVQVDLLVVTHAHLDHIGCLPAIVQNGTLRAKWALVVDPGLGWGRPAGGDAAADAPLDPVVAAFREEVPSEGIGNDVLSQLLVDAAGLEQGYNAMLAKLEADGTTVVRYGRDDHQPLLDTFARVGLSILGPSKDQLLLCAKQITGTTKDAADRLADLRSRGDLPQTSVDQYKLLLRSTADLMDAEKRPGPAVNLQSIVTLFSLGGAKLLFAGDMQLADPQIGGPAMQKEVDDLLAAIRAEAPFDVFKLCHHGSDNGLDEKILPDFSTTPVFGICAGQGSKSHPNPAVLELLAAESDKVKWVRTDHNGLSTVELAGNKTTLEVDHGDVNDPRPNTQDVAAPAAAATPAGPVLAPASTMAAPALGGYVEVTARVPLGARATVTVDATANAATSGPVAGAGDRFDPLTVGNGRNLPRLLVCTSAAQLAANVGALEAGHALDAVRAHPSLVLYDGLPAGVSAVDAQRAVVERLHGDGSIKGVVVLGGLDVVPSHRRDALPPRLRQQLGQTEDPDDFIVWSDEAYGDLDGDAIAELPVSRIPDGRSPDLLFAALGAGDETRRLLRQGVRNQARPFAEDVYALVQGDGGLLVSQPVAPTAVPPLQADIVYLMLHGDYGDSSRFWGEDKVGSAFEAVNVTNVPRGGGRVVVAGCCWGALTVEQPALRAQAGVAPAPKAVGASMALSFLLGGATAFVGCTGVHYSPKAPGDYFGGPMHKAVISALRDGIAPAEALFRAKADYAANMPHGQGRPLDQAIEFKILNEFTCLGLGW